MTRSSMLPAISWAACLSSSLILSFFVGYIFLFSPLWDGCGSISTSRFGAPPSKVVHHLSRYISSFSLLLLAFSSLSEVLPSPIMMDTFRISCTNISILFLTIRCPVSITGEIIFSSSHSAVHFILRGNFTLYGPCWNLGIHSQIYSKEINFEYIWVCMTWLNPAVTAKDHICVNRKTCSFMLNRTSHSNSFAINLHYQIANPKAWQKPKPKPGRLVL